MKSEIEKSWNRLAKLANEHLKEGLRFNKLCVKYYGIHWQSLKSLEDDDEIIDTIDYGYGTLLFKKFDVKVQTAIKQKRFRR